MLYIEITQVLPKDTWQWENRHLQMEVIPLRFYQKSKRWKGKGY